MEEKCVEIIQEEMPEAVNSEENTDPMSDETVSGELTEGENAGTTGGFRDKNPEDLLQYIEKYVTIQLESNNSYVGFVHSIDPITYSIIMSVPRDGSYRSVLIPGTSVINMVETSHNSSITLPQHKQIQEVSSDARNLQKRKIISWLKDNMLPVVEDGDNVTFGGISLLPPYGITDVCTANPLVALEMQKIIDRMPADYQPK